MSATLIESVGKLITGTNSTSTRSWIGIDLAAREIRLAQRFEQSGAYHYLTSTIDLTEQSFDVVDAIDQGRLSDLIRDEVEQGGFEGTSVACVLPSSYYEYRHLQMPPCSAKELDDAIAMELSDGEELSVAFDYWMLPARGQDEAMRDVDVVTLPRNAAEQVVEQLSQASLVCRVIDCHAVTASRFIARRVTEADGAGSHRSDAMHAVLVWDSQEAVVNLIQQGVPIYQRMFSELGFDGVIDRLKKEFGLTRPQARLMLAQYGLVSSEGEGSDAVVSRIASVLQPILQELADELDQTFSFLSGRYRCRCPQSLSIAGAALPGLDVVLAEAFEVPTKFWIPETKTSNNDFPWRDAGAAQAIALTMLGGD